MTMNNVLLGPLPDATPVAPPIESTQNTSCNTVAFGGFDIFIRGILHRDCLNVLCTPLGSQSHAVHHPHRMRVEDFKVAMGLEGQSAIAGLQHVKVPSFTNGGASHSSWMDCMLVLALL